MWEGKQACEGSVLSLMFFLLVSGCQLPRSNDQPVAIDNLVELDEYTDPVFFNPAVTGAIGEIQPFGSRVRVNGVVQRRRGALANQSHVVTGKDSYARLQLYRVQQRRCRLEIRRLHSGRLFGSTEGCLHSVSTPYGVGGSLSSSTQYHIKVEPGGTDFVAVEGMLGVRSAGGAGRMIRVPGRHRIFIDRTGRVEGPSPLSPSALKAILTWRQRLRPRSRPQPPVNDPMIPRSPPTPVPIPPSDIKPGGFGRQIIRYR